MKTKILGVLGNWRQVADAARTTIGKDVGQGDPSSSWKRRMLLCEHSPIRKLHISWKWENLMYWVSVHFVRHKYGIEHWISTQRTDRTGENRNDKSQDAKIIHEAQANAQAIISISRKRLCAQASGETRSAWREFLYALTWYEPELVKCCVPDCVYRGWCYEYKSCGYHETEAYRKQLEEYREGINGWGNSDEH